MNHTKKLLSLLLALAMAVSLTACGGNCTHPSGQIRDSPKINFPPLFISGIKAPPVLPYRMTLASSIVTIFSTTPPDMR